MEEGRERYEAYVTLATNDTYALGCLVLGNSLRRVGTTRQLVVLITQGVSPAMRRQLDGLFDLTVEVNVLDSNDTANLELLGRPDLSVTFTKLHCWRLTQFKKCVFMDADTLVLQNIDELFDKEELSAAPDAGWPDCFNSGVFVYVPSDETYRSLLTFAVTTGSFDGGDQGLLNLYFSNWATADIGRHLPFTYNVVSQAFYSYLPALKQFHDTIKVVHFIGPVKPWHHAYNTATRTVTQLPDTVNNQEFLQLWWDIFMETVQPNLDPSVAVYIRLEHKPPPEVPEVSETKHDYGNQLQRDHRGHGDMRAEPTTSYQVLYPYTPPDVDRSPQPPSESTVLEDASRSHVMDVPVVYRDYKAFETHYSEEPLSAVNPELPPQDHYFASVEIIGPHFTFGEEVKNNRNENNAQQFDSVSTGEMSRDNDKHHEIVAQTENVDSPDVPREEHDVSGHVEDSRKDVQEPAETDDKDENENIPEKGGIVRDLANLTLEGDSGTSKSDLERRLQWEHGQADYMGVDKFDNIKARLDEKIAKPLPSGSKSSVVEKEVRPIAQSISSSDSDGVASVVTLTGEGSGIQDCQQEVVLCQTHGVDESEAEAVVEPDIVDSVTSLTNQPSQTATVFTQPVSDVVVKSPTAESAIPASTDVAVTPDPTFGALTPDSTAESAIPASTDVAVTPDPTFGALTPDSTAESAIPASTDVAFTPDPTFGALTPDSTAETVTLSPIEEGKVVTSAFISDVATPAPSGGAINSSLTSEAITLSSSAGAVSVPIAACVTQADTTAEIIIPSPKADAIPTPSNKTLKESETVTSASTVVVSSPSASEFVATASAADLKKDEDLVTPTLISQSLSPSAAQPVVTSTQLPQSAAGKPEPTITSILSSPTEITSSTVNVPQAIQSSPVTTPVSLPEQVEPILQPLAKEQQCPIPPKPKLASASFSPVSPPVAPKPRLGTSPTVLKPSPFAPSTAAKPVTASFGASPSAVAPPTAAKLSPTSPPPIAPKPVLTPSTPQTIQPTLPAAHVPEPSKPTEPKHKTTPFSIKKEPAPLSKPLSPPATTQPSPASKPVETPAFTKPQPSAASKPLSPSSVAAPKVSLVASQASRFEKPTPATSGAAASKPTGPLAQMASRFESPGIPKSLPFGASAKSPIATSPISTKTTEAAAKSPIATSPISAKTTGAAAKSPITTFPISSKGTGASASPSKADTPTSGPATNRDEMFSRFGIRLPPPKNNFV